MKNRTVPAPKAAFELMLKRAGRMIRPGPVPDLLTARMIKRFMDADVRAQEVQDWWSKMGVSFARDVVVISEPVRELIDVPADELARFDIFVSGELEKVGRSVLIVTREVWSIWKQARVHGGT